MKTLFKLALVAIIAMIATTVFAQEWTKEQKEVWQVIDNSWMNWKAGNIEAATAALHEKYQGWSTEAPLPMNKAATVQWFQSMKDIPQSRDYWINPARIAVTQNAAVVHYYFQFTVTYAMGDQKKQVKEQGKYVEFYVKEGGKWLCLGDMTVIEDEDDAED
jgi:hypothetical protein